MTIPPDLSSSSPPSLDYMQGQSYRGSAISNLASQESRTHSREPSQLSEFHPSFARVSALNPNLESVSELEGPGNAVPASRHELSGRQEIRVFRVSTAAPASPSVVAATDQHNPEGPAAQPHRRAAENELHMWDG